MSDEEYYMDMEGVKCDRRLIEFADGAVAGDGDGRISIDDAKALFAAAADNDVYTDIEKSTMEYIRENYNFTPEADAWFRTEVRKWATANKREIVGARLDAMAAFGSGKTPDNGQSTGVVTGRRRQHRRVVPPAAGQAS